MQQMDLFDETLEKKIFRMEKWIGRLHKELWFLKEVYQMSKKNHIPGVVQKIECQSDIWGA